MCFTALDAVVGQIKDDTAKKYASLAVSTLSELVAILTDSEKPDKIAAIEAWVRETAKEKEIALVELVEILVTNTRQQGSTKQSFLNMLKRIKDLIEAQ